jgi:hypothetical protein
VQANVQVQTDCSNGSCQQKTITTDPNGNVISVVTGGAQSQSDFCKANPTSKQCAGSGSGSGTGGGGDGSGAGFSGDCGAGFACVGGEDAVTCAIAMEQHQRDCQFVTNFGDGSPNALNAKGLAMALQGDAGDSDHPHRSGNISVTDLSAGFDQTDLLGHASCLPDRTIGPIVLPLSKLCAPADIAGQALLGITSIACLFIVFGPRKG